MITKSEFLSGVPFNTEYLSKRKPFVFKKTENWKNGDAIGHISYMHMYECNVRRVGNKYIDCYTSICSKIVNVRIYFKDLYI